MDFPREPGVRLAGKRFQGAKLKPGECEPDETDIVCASATPIPRVGLKPELPLGRLSVRR